MLVFMVVQLAGSAGTYPVEVSPSFVAKIHAYVPFTYTVDAFRATISGGRSITTSIIVMVALLVIFTILTILQFNHMTKRKKAGKVVLEVELPEDSLKKRRIGFYERHGFTFNEYPYIQPPMGEDRHEIPLRIMSAPEPLSEDEFQSVRTELYESVYHYVCEE